MTGDFRTLHDFVVSDGKDPTGQLFQGADGFFYGTTRAGRTTPASSTRSTRAARSRCCTRSTAATARSRRLERPLLAAPIAALFIVPVVAFLALRESAIVIAFAAFVLGFFAAISGIFFETALQHNIPSDKLSRVAAYDITASFASIPLGVILVGFIATRFGTSTTLWIAEVTVTVAGIATLLAQDVRSIGSAPATEAACPRVAVRRTRRATARSAPARSA